MEEIQTLVDLLGRVEFIAGLIAGSVALALLAGAIPRERPRPCGLAVGLATLATIHAAIGRRLGFTLAIALVLSGDGHKREDQPRVKTLVCWMDTHRGRRSPRRNQR